MEVRRVLPYVVGLVILAFALGSLPRGTAGGSVLLGSYWLLYLAYLGPVAILGITISLIIVIGLNWRDLGTGIGYGMARRRAIRKKRNTMSFIIYGLFWALALGILITRKGTIFNPNTTNTIAKEIVGVGSTPSNPIPTGLSQAISGFIDTSWFSFAFLGLLVVAGLVMIQAARASLGSTSQLYTQGLITRQEEGLHAVHDAIRLVKDTANDPRSRIISSYERLVATVASLGAPVSSDLTARELESAIRSTFMLKGPATSQLTSLFEEARYSLHDIVEDDAVKAREYLQSISQELKIHLDNET